MVYLLDGRLAAITHHRFAIHHTCRDSDARSGVLETAHGPVVTPAFMPVGSQATVKALSSDDVRDCGYDILLCNAYHLYLRPGVDVVRAGGGLHRFMSWDRAILTDSGGFQVYSLAPLRRMDDDGVTFRSHIDGSLHRLTPEKSMEIQQGLGADIIMVLDDVAPAGADRSRLSEAVDRTHRWAERCISSHHSPDQWLFAIVQGGADSALRRHSARTLAAMGFPGYAVGGLSVGEPKQVMYEVLRETVPQLPADKPHYLMGVGAPEDIVEAVWCGIDMLDCVLPTRVARNGAVFTRDGRRNIRHGSFKSRWEPVEADCDCFTCRTYSAAYLHHLFRCEELLAYRLATIHNLRFMHRLVVAMREAIAAGSLASFRSEFLARYRVTDESVRLRDKAVHRSGRRVGEAAGGMPMSDGLDG
jgi:queuine tRNA-ribosyltransferase